ncbi:hypothetical protein BURMUCF1_B0047 [Burkholderia multivorans ATCC BAA-247]|uniref:Uncharacterized protein n=1 Tax=Burkholderia multivorans CGD2 TaxID=513052 RepID=B9BWQ1_9BURK|nr:hypothetical protein BURMUCGD2_6138 [Burkholderia multivorans CGD2]EEE13408.1 hypothetical protein BURMUCGD2M_6127 [Burkholderia multivorans CGD2M]EJO57423.1 hypothetical protein BURMUCF1_B0047 [Burkholderia multivorans ATCC BAA-247]
MSRFVSRSDTPDVAAMTMNRYAQHAAETVSFTSPLRPP